MAGDLPRGLSTLEPGGGEHGCADRVTPGGAYRPGGLGQSSAARDYVVEKHGRASGQEAGRARTDGECLPEVGDTLIACQSCLVRHMPTVSQGT
jgi:hypothetical protein